MSEKKMVYLFDEGSKEMKNLLGGKGANLSEMVGLNIPVPPGFIITTEVCNDYYENDSSFPETLREQVKSAISSIEKKMSMRFGDPEDPLLFSVRSGARISMPGMMDTILNLGINRDIVKGLIKRSGDERFAWDTYRRFIQMYGDVVLGIGDSFDDDVDPFEDELARLKLEKGVNYDSDLSGPDLEVLSTNFIKIIKDRLNIDFPDDPWDQLWGAVGAVFSSWRNKRAITYRNMNSIPSIWGTAVNVQSMVFGNMGEGCATGVAFTRDPSTGRNVFYGEYLQNAQGEDVVAGIRTPLQVTKRGSMEWAVHNGTSEAERLNKHLSLEEIMPGIFKELEKTYLQLEAHYHDMQDIEFTIQNGVLWLLQTRTGKRTAAAAIKIAVDMVNEGLITKKEAILRVEPEQLDQLLHPAFDMEKKGEVIARGLPASPGAATGQIVFNADDAETLSSDGDRVILVRIETSPEDIGGMKSSEGILTARGGMTSHAAVVARGMGKCCVSGCSDLNISYKDGNMKIGDRVLSKGEWISLNGSTGEIMLGMTPTKPPSIGGDFKTLMSWADQFKKLGVRTNADTPEDAKVAREFGAEGIGLCRTEHMFFEGERILAMRKMILSETEEERVAALDQLLPMQKEDFKGIFREMDGFPVTIRLLDPPLHEFLPHDQEAKIEVARELGITMEHLEMKISSLKEFNPMLGHRGCRLGITYPEITKMQATAIVEAAVASNNEGIVVSPEIMIPLVGVRKELENQRNIISEIIERVFTEMGTRIDIKIGTMIEIPRAALTADEIARSADFFSFGTNDLTQMTFGYSRDDSSTFLPEYVDKNILSEDPFKVLDGEGVGQLVKMGTKKGRSTNPLLKVGICGEHGGEPSSIKFCHDTGLDYVSCSPYRVPIARLSAAHSNISDEI
ncbi:MAG: pyruvate, phosphate dikinase [Thermoplasmata archaeon]|nr:pyruvate, phosphate dikinase [Thermoplasmata archaeon]